MYGTSASDTWGEILRPPEPVVFRKQYRSTVFRYKEIRGIYSIVYETSKKWYCFLF
jgi:hypothetical protein